MHPYFNFAMWREVEIITMFFQTPKELNDYLKITVIE